MSPREEVIIELFNSGTTQQEIAKVFSCSKSHISSIVCAARAAGHQVRTDGRGRPRKEPKLTSDERILLMKWHHLWNKGYTVAQIMPMLGLPPKTAERRILALRTRLGEQMVPGVFGMNASNTLMPSKEEAIKGIIANAQNEIMSVMRSGIQ